MKYKGVLITPIPLTSPPLSPRDITDGLSQTAAVAEWRNGVGTMIKSDQLGSLYLFLDGGLLEQCESGRYEEAQVSMYAKGMNWLGSGYGRSQYTHMLPPNRPSCNLRGSNFSAATVGSNHPRGANVLLLDGSVHFVTDAVNRATWKALGTSSSGESFDWISIRQVTQIRVIYEFISINCLVS